MMDPAIPLVLAESLPAPRLPVSLWEDSLASSPVWTSSLQWHQTLINNLYSSQHFISVNNFQSCSNLRPHLLYLPVRAPKAPPANVLKWGVSPRVPGATESPSLGVVVLRPLTAPSRLLSPRLGDLSARHASATAERLSQLRSALLLFSQGFWFTALTCDWTVVLIEVDPDTPAFPPAHAAASSSAQRDGHHSVHVGQHDGNADAWKTKKPSNI